MTTLDHRPNGMFCWLEKQSFALRTPDPTGSPVAWLSPGQKLSPPLAGAKALGSAAAPQNLNPSCRAPTPSSQAMVLQLLPHAKGYTTLLLDPHILESSLITFLRLPLGRAQGEHWRGRQWLSCTSEGAE